MRRPHPHTGLTTLSSLLALKTVRSTAFSGLVNALHNSVKWSPLSNIAFLVQIKLTLNDPLSIAFCIKTYKVTLKRKRYFDDISGTGRTGIYQNDNFQKQLKVYQVLFKEVNRDARLILALECVKQSVWRLFCLYRLKLNIDAT